MSRSEHPVCPRLGLAVLLVAGWLSGPTVAAEIDPLRDPLTLLEALEKRRLDLDKRSKELNFKEEELKRLEERIDKRIGTLETLRLELQKDISKEKEIDDANIARLAKIFSGMPTKAAAVRLQNLDREVAVKVLKLMREKMAAKILGNMSAKEAVELSRELGISIEERKKSSP